MSTDRPDGEEPYSGIPQAGGIILRMLLGTQLRRLRVGFKARDITDLLSLYGTTGHGTASRPAPGCRALPGSRGPA